MSAWIESAQSVNSFFAILKTTRALPRLALPCRALPRLAKPSRAEPCPVISSIKALYAFKVKPVPCRATPCRA